MGQSLPFTFKSRREHVPRRSPKAATEIAQYEREAKALGMRAQGHNFQSIADTLGYADASGASKAYHRALARKPAQNVDQIRAQEAERLEYCWRKTSPVIECPPVKTTSTGFNQYDPRTGPCTCGGIKNGPRIDHSPECAVKPILDEGKRLQAITEYRHLSESYRKMCGVDLDAPAVNPEFDTWFADHQKYVAALVAENRNLREQLATLGSVQAPRAITAPTNGHRGGY